IMASSVQGVGFLSSAGARTGPTERRRSEARAPRATCRTMVDDLPGNRRDIAQRSRTFMPNLAEKSSADLSRAAACGLGKKITKPVRRDRSALALGARVVGGGVALEKLDHKPGDIDAGRLLEPLDAGRGVDLEHERPVLRAQQIDAADIEAEGARSLHRRGSLLRRDAHLFS